ncbi:hypothetical protein OOK60_05545 [Trichothermofontia sichuanensis B231]|uniref:hypothetical protein n=1 Tax=Trichothermofontia sichuanensis TaxID=3045816 RepID=UPI00224739F9|nr:hypothetical protein [Trichothermofontia sichuanensis]UZQ55538.1 hypothetical protein OOK60_05545 [Trichothermofontia sichuanensis B231]
MSVERWTDERLDQLAQLVDSNSRAIQALANLAAEDRQEGVAILQSLQVMQQQVAVMQQQVQEIQQEVRGVQTENQRILDILLKERRPDGPDNPEN